MGANTSSGLDLLQAGSTPALRPGLSGVPQPISRNYAALAQQLMAAGLSDPWVDGKPRFGREPVRLSPAQVNELVTAAELFAAAMDHTLRMLAKDPAAMADLHLTPYQEMLWQTSAGRWHGIARADAFFCPDGVRICEVNCDTPSGQPEAVILGQLAAADAPEAIDPNRFLLDRYAALLQATAPADRKGQPLSVGILYPTELTEDLAMVELYTRDLTARGWQVVHGSPFNLHLGADGRAALWGQPCDVLIRHYKTDWWTERQPVWQRDEPFADSAPLDGPLAILLAAQLQGRTTVVNPMGAVVPQNKRFLASMWQMQTQLPAELAQAVQRYLPETKGLDHCDLEVIRAQRQRWVLKSDYGAEGSEVVVGAEVSQADWLNYVDSAKPTRFVVQAHFDAQRTAGMQTNFGVFLVAGRGAGLYARHSVQATDPGACSVAVLVERSAGANAVKVAQSGEVAA